MRSKDALINMKYQFEGSFQLSVKIKSLFPEDRAYGRLGRCSERVRRGY